MTSKTLLKFSQIQRWLEADLSSPARQVELFPLSPAFVSWQEGPARGIHIDGIDGNMVLPDKGWHTCQVDAQRQADLY